ncbi:B12-binding domain-containing radical SAM protein [Candidatus Omnitrophota bacterium]
MPDIVYAGFRNGPVVLVSRRIEFTFVLSYAYLAAYLRQKGEDVRVLFRPASASGYHDLVKQIMAANPVLVGFGSLYPELQEVGRLIRMLDEAGRKFPVVVGGQMVTPIPEFAVGITGVDFGVLGEGEITLCNLVRALREGKDPATVKGLVIRQKDDFIFTGQGDIIEDLSGLPSIPYDLFPAEDWLCIGRWYARYCPQPHWRFKDRVINVHAGRGCPFTCNFCYHHSKPRFRSMDIAINEAKEAMERFDGNMLYFSDETTLPSPQRARQMLDAIKKIPRRIEYSVSSRFDILDKLDDDLLKEMKETGCRIMGLGIESGSDRVLSVIGKKFTSETVRKGLKRLKEAGILPTVSIMVGQYTETSEDVEASIALMKESVRENRDIQYAFTLATPFPGSELYNLIIQKGYLRDDKEFYDLYFKSGKGDFRYVVNLSGMTDEGLMAMHKKINNVYAKEKSITSRPVVAKVEFLMRGIEAVHNILDKKTLTLRKNRFFRMLYEWQERLREFIQISLDNLRLKLYRR